MTAPAPAPQAPRPTPEAGTEYVILERDHSGLWKEDGRVTARTPEAAIKANGVDSVCVYVAIPARSWKPIKVTPQTVTTLKLEEAK